MFRFSSRVLPAQNFLFFFFAAAIRHRPSFSFFLYDFFLFFVFCYGVHHLG